MPEIRSRFNFWSGRQQKFPTVIEKVHNNHLSYLGIEALDELVQVAIRNEKQQLPGIIIEAGCALGGSAICLASIKSKNRGLFVYDVFGMIPPPSESDGQDVQERYGIIALGKSTGIGGKKYYGYEENLYSKVLQEFNNFGIDTKKNNIHLIKGLFEDTINIDSPVSLAHIDCDWHDSVLTCLMRLEPHLVSGGTLVIDDYYSWSGCRTAVDEYFKNRKGYDFVQKSRLHIIKK